MEPTLPENSVRFSLRIMGAERGRDRCAALRPGPTLVGSRAGCDIRLRSAKVSPVHCAIVHTANQLVLRDLASNEGTRVNDWEADTRALAAGDRIQIRPWEFVVQAAGDAANARHDSTNIPESVETQHGVHQLPAAERMVLRDDDGKCVLKSRCPVVLIGRNAACDVAPDDSSVSHAHALLYHTPDGWAVADLLSTNGTHVNDHAIDPRKRDAEPALLKDGDALRFGACGLTVHFGADSGDWDAEGTVGATPEPRDDAEIEDRARRVDELQREVAEREVNIAAKEQDLAGRLTAAARTVDLCERRTRAVEAREAAVKAAEENLEAERASHAEYARAVAEREAAVEREAKLDRELRRLLSQSLELRRERNLTASPAAGPHRSWRPSVIRARRP